jgi:dsDNA-specific endonuclease/ATPase MutS2
VDDRENEAVGPDDEDPPIRLPIDGELDLHTFHPREIKELVPDYLELCRRKGLLEVRIVHGKGTGALRETVHAILNKLPSVKHFSLAPANRGHWGATLVTLEAASEKNTY